MSLDSDLPILIVAFRAAGLLDKCLTSVKRFHSGQDVLIWDNSGRGYSEVQRVAARYPEFGWHANGQNIGFAAAVNRLAAMVPGRDFLLLNPDAELIAPLAETLSALSQSRVAAVGPMGVQRGFGAPRLTPRHVPRSYLGQTPWDVAHRKLTLVNALFDRTGLGRLRGTPFSVKYRFPPHEVDGYVSGGCLAIRRKAWDELGSFDEEFFMYGEEMEWQHRAVKAGWTIRLADEVVMRHIGRGTVSADVELLRRSEDLLFANKALFIEYRYGRRFAEIYLGWLLGLAAAKRAVRGAGGSGREAADVVLFADGADHLMREAVSTALALKRCGYRVAVVSLQRVGLLAQELPPSIRLLRRPWWWPHVGKPRSSAVFVGSTPRQRACERLLKLRRGVTAVGARELLANASQHGPPAPL